VKEQADEIFSKLPPSEFRFSSLAQLRKEIDPSFFYEPVAQAKTSKQVKVESIKSTALF
jgi:hypothetical protein